MELDLPGSPPRPQKFHGIPGWPCPSGPASSSEVLALRAQSRSRLCSRSAYNIVSLLYVAFWHPAPQRPVPTHRPSPASTNKMIVLSAIWPRILEPHFQSRELTSKWSMETQSPGFPSKRAETRMSSAKLLCTCRPLPPSS